MTLSQGCKRCWTREARPPQRTKPISGCPPEHLRRPLAVGSTSTVNRSLFCRPCWNCWFVPSAHGYGQRPRQSAVQVAGTGKRKQESRGLLLLSLSTVRSVVALPK